ncbi:MAG: hypothetical protein SH848_15035 [Saprospiraceae bacterium]|nr:hypothetical protein [Saprospiraceae bacterium]MDZ4705240.1 hypothetical protein [Saprospiraceae bacterium]
MHAETHYLHNRYTRLLKWSSISIAVFQLTALAGAETGLSWTPLGLVVHSLLLLLAVACFLFATHISLGFRVSDKGFEIRYFPYHWQYRQITWKEIRHAQLLLPGALQPNAPFGYPGRDLNRIYLLTCPEYAILQLNLVNSVQLFISILHAQELTDYLEHGMLRPEFFLRTSLKPTP